MITTLEQAAKVQQRRVAAKRRGYACAVKRFAKREALKCLSDYDLEQAKRELQFANGKQVMQYKQSMDAYRTARLSAATSGFEVGMQEPRPPVKLGILSTARCFGAYLTILNSLPVENRTSAEISEHDKQVVAERAQARKKKTTKKKVTKKKVTKKKVAKKAAKKTATKKRRTVKKKTT